jgi:hypothetical protein
MERVYNHSNNILGTQEYSGTAATAMHFALPNVKVKFYSQELQLLSRSVSGHFHRQAEVSGNFASIPTQR